MCVIIHKPAGVEIPEDLLAAAGALNPDGWGLMGIADDGRLLVRRGLEVDAEEVYATATLHRNAELVLHLRRRTRGGVDEHNLHPFQVAPGVLLMHNGTLRFESRRADRSDTWHFVTDILRPLHQRHPGLLLDNAFHRVLEHGLKAENKAVLLDHARRRIVVLNRQHGFEFEGLWLSSSRWIDSTRLRLARPPQPQERTWQAERVAFS
jgi:predicted glutamine amidotransferase